MTARWLAPLLLLVSASALHAHEGPPYCILMDEKAGPYKVSIWADPDVGTGTFWVYVESPSGASTQDVKVSVSVAPTSGRLPEATYPAERQVVGRQVQFYAEVQFDEQEYWKVRIDVSGPEGSGEVSAEVEATPPGPGRWDILLYLFPFAFLAGLWVFGVLRHRRRRVGNAQGGDVAANKTVVALLLFSCAAWATQASAAAPPVAPRFETLSNSQAWKLLPREEPPLPAWARTLAESLPRTTGHLLALDHLHRAGGPLDVDLRGKLRWAAADVNHCDYAKRYAEFDLKRAGVSADAIKALAGDLKKLPQKERAAVQFARKMSRAAHTVTDDEMAELIRLFGEKKVVAMVHALAWANFQDRLLVALGVEVEKGGPLPPLEFRVAQGDSTKSAAPARPEWESVRAAKVADEKAKPDWRSLEFADVRKLLEAQKERKTRIKPPPADSLAKLPPDVRSRMEKIGWSAVSLGYEPKLTMAWFDCMGTFSQEARLNSVFSASLFWVVTRGVDCFY
jgi:alkylhydroperoxidase family enzyme